jgi:hypothetical protein
MPGAVLVDLDLETRRHPGRFWTCRGLQAGHGAPGGSCRPQDGPKAVAGSVRIPFARTNVTSEGLVATRTAISAPLDDPLIT